MSIRTLNDRIAVDMKPGAGMIGAIHIPDATKSTRNQTFCWGVVVAAGPNAKLANQGASVIVSEYFGDEVEVDGKKLRVGRERDIVGVIRMNVIEPPDDRVLLQRVDAPKMVGLLHLPEDVNRPQFWGKVVAIGPDCTPELTGKEAMVQKHLAVEVRFEGKEYLLADEPSLLAIR